MATQPPPLNPYQPTTEVSQEVRYPTDPDEPDSVGRVARRWFLVCGISALPSFFFGFSLSGGRLSGMLLGIFLFAIGYTALDLNTADWPIRKKPSIRRTLKIAYGTRVAISIIFPIGMYLDLVCGIFSVGIVSTVFDGGMEPFNGPNGDKMSFLGTLITTLVQGCILNLVLGAYGLLVLLVHALFSAVKRARTNHS
ncbi:MAG: hypothetical protein AAGG48_12410 [Planctomycetota bacterium]